jgi:predicted DNA binding protein
MMRKVTIELEPNESAKELSKSTFTRIHSYEVLEVLKMDYEEGIYVDLIECHLKEGTSIPELTTIGDMEILSILKNEGNKIICLVKGHNPELPRSTYKELDLNLIYTTPSFISQNKIIVSFIGTQKSLTQFIELVKHTGKIIKMTFKKTGYEKKDVLSVLTGKQRGILIAAYNHGYYDLPKKINSVQLAQKLHISKPTLLEHLRKAEKRILAELMIGYTQ